MYKIIIVGILSVGLVLFSGCKKRLGKNKVAVNSVKTINGKKVIMVEIADKSIADKGTDSLMTAQRAYTVKNYFDSYNIGSDGRVVASVYNYDKNKRLVSSDIWMFGRGKTRVTNSNYFNETPSLSNDSKNIYFSSTKGHEIRTKGGLFNEQHAYIWRMASAGAGGIGRIGTPAYKYELPVVSPDGKYLLFSQIDFFGNKPYVWYMGVNGELPTQLKEGIHARWVNSEQIVYSEFDSNTNLYTIWRMNIDGTALTQMIVDNNLHCIQPVPSPDGKYIAYVKQEKKGDINTRDVYVYNAETGISHQITTNKSRDDMPQWSSDSKYLHFRSSRGGSWNIWRINIDRI